MSAQLDIGGTSSFSGNALHLGVGFPPATQVDSRGEELCKIGVVLTQHRGEHFPILAAKTDEILVDPCTNLKGKY